MVESNLYFLGRPLCGVLRPYFLTETMHGEVIEAAGAFAEGLRKLSELLLDDAELRHEVGLTPEEEQVLTFDREPRELVGRVDGFLGDDGRIRFLEYNPEPAALINLFKVSSIFESLPIMRSFGEAHSVRNPTAYSALMEAFFELGGKMAEEGGITVVRPTVVDGDEVTESQHDLEIDVAVKTVASLGMEMHVVAAEELTCRDGRVFHGDRALDLTYIFDWPNFFDTIGLAHPFWEVLRDGGIQVVNTLSGRILHGNKGTFAVLSDPRFADLFEPTVAASLQQHVPWTRLVRPGETEWRGETVDLLPWIEREREHLVLKPSSSYGGLGVVLGWRSDPAEWSRALAEALKRPYVVQERVHTQRESFPLFADSTFAPRECLVDLNTFVWRTEKPQGYLARISGSDLTNVTAGTSTTAPVFVLQA
ncbi:MAG: hypothetical protein AAF682_16515 [Planctomycetota bacterium]